VQLTLVIQMVQTGSSKWYSVQQQFQFAQVLWLKESRIDREAKKAINAVENLSSHSSKNELMLLLEFANGRSK
jgi:hypothetical protein